MSARHRMSVTTRITMFTGVVAALLSALLATVLMIAINRLATEYLTDEVTAAGERVATEVELIGLRAPVLHGQVRNIQVVDRRGEVVASTHELRGKPAMARFIPDDLKKTATSVVCDGVFTRGECDIVVAQWAHRPDGSYIVYSASPVVPPLVHPHLALLVGASAVLLTAVVTYLGHRIATASLRPVEAIREELDEINATCPGRRVPVPPSDDEIHDLADSVNHTLNRLQDAMEQQRQFASDASHDLRTPIAAMRAEVEDALHAPQETNVTKVSSAILGSLDRLQAIVCDLLAIGRLDAGIPGARDPIDLTELVTAELRTRHHSTKSINCALEPGVLVIGDRLRLARLVNNLLDNAERHANTTITITVRHEPSGKCDDQGDRRFAHGAALLEVLDDGDGIDPDKRELVFQRFIRLEASRDKDAGGTGLGLPIARQIAETSGGTLRIKDSPRGAHFVLCLPSASSANGDAGAAPLVSGDMPGSAAPP